MLSKIVDETKKRIIAQKKEKSLDELKSEVSKLEISKDFPFERALKEKPIAIISEVKKASPSKGLIDEDFEYLEIAKEYDNAGVSAISVLTEPTFFKGSNKYLKEISEIVDVPLLRKDFVIDEYMIYEAKLLGADAILLIVAILDDEQLRQYFKIANKLGLSSIFEAHDKNEVKRAIGVGARIIGVNNRNLKDFTVDIKNSLNLRKYVPEDIIFISESGIRTPQDVCELKNNNVRGVLIGETLMRSDNKTKLIKELKYGEN